MQNIAKHLEWLYLYQQVFPGGSVGKESACNEGDLDSIPELGRSLGEGNGYPIQDSGLENPMDCIVQEVAKSRTQMSEFHFHIYIRKTDIRVKNTNRYLLLFSC